MKEQKKQATKTLKKSAESPKHSPKAEGPTTIQDMADGFNYLAERITKNILNPYVKRQADCDELRNLYIT